jgi:hypothetical protein
MVKGLVCWFAHHSGVVQMLESIINTSTCACTYIYI